MKVCVYNFTELTTNALYEILKARVNVFVVEQNCPYPELDDIDYRSIHVYLEKNDKILGYCRVFQKEDDIVISASVELLLKEILNRIGVKQYICTVLDVENGEITEFCYRKTKVSLFQSKYPNTVIENFYTDSENDRAMIKIAKKSFLVKGNSVKQIKQMEE